jgi:hypothetical protein
VPFLPAAFPRLTRLGLGGTREAAASFYVGSSGRGGDRGPRSSQLRGDAAATVLRALAGAAGISLSMNQARATAEDLAARRRSNDACEPTNAFNPNFAEVASGTAVRGTAETEEEEDVCFSWEGFSGCRVDLFEGVFETRSGLNHTSAVEDAADSAPTVVATATASSVDSAERSATAQPSMPTLKVRLPSRVQLSCGVCGAVLVPSVGPPYARGPPSQPHIGFEFYFNQVRCFDLVPPVNFFACQILCMFWGYAWLDLIKFSVFSWCSFL